MLLQSPNWAADLVDTESGQRSVLFQDIEDRASWLGEAFRSQAIVILSENISETVLNADSDFLSAWEFHAASSKSFNSLISELLLGSDGVQNLVDLDSCAFTNWLTEGTSHTGLKSIGSGAGQHFIDTKNVPRMDSASEMERVFTSEFDHVLVGSDTAGFQGFRTELFLFQRNQMDAEWEFINISSLLSSVVDTDSWVRATSAVSGLWIWFTTPVSVASCRSSSHFLYLLLFF